jgi:hypothetical protein
MIVRGGRRDRDDPADLGRTAQRDDDTFDERAAADRYECFVRRAGRGCGDGIGCTAGQDDRVQSMS